MAKHENAPDNKGKIKFIYFELEGSNETLQESLQTISQTLGRQVILRGQVMTQPALESGSTKALPAPDETADYKNPGEVEVAATPTPTPAKTKNTNTVRRPTVLQEVEIDLTGGELPLQTFFDQKGHPDSQAKQCLLISAWLKEQRHLDAINANLVYTCFRHLHLNVPEDISQNLRYGVRKKWYRRVKPGFYEIIHVGTNIVDAMH